MRVDFDVPMQDGHILDDHRIRAALPTIEALRSRGAKVIVLTHLGRPGGRRDENLSVRALACRLGKLLNTVVMVAGDSAGHGARDLVDRLPEGAVGMLENIGFEPGEERNAREVALRLAGLADVYVNDAFGSAHRAHASTDGVARLLPALAGNRLTHELQTLDQILHTPARPLVAIIGGARIASTLVILHRLLPRVDTIWLGGAIASTFYRALGADTGTSLTALDGVGAAAALLERANGAGGRLRLPEDVVVAAEPRAAAATEVVPWNRIRAGHAVVDIGPRTVARIAESCASAGTVVWKGPLGICEVARFALGTRGVARSLADSTAASVVGGGDLVAALHTLRITDRITHVSTAGEALLEYLGRRTLPGIQALVRGEELSSVPAASGAVSGAPAGDSRSERQETG